jgi:hypothetical protein
MAALSVRAFTAHADLRILMRGIHAARCINVHLSPGNSTMITRLIADSGAAPGQDQVRIGGRGPI